MQRLQKRSRVGSYGVKPCDWGSRGDVIDPVLSFIGEEYLFVGTVSKDWNTLWSQTGKQKATSASACTSKNRMESGIFQYESDKRLGLGKNFFDKEYRSMGMTSTFCKWYFDHTLTLKGMRRLLDMGLSARLTVDLGATAMSHDGISLYIKSKFLESIAETVKFCRDHGRVPYYQLLNVGRNIVQRDDLPLMREAIRYLGNMHIGMCSVVQDGSEAMIGLVHMSGVGYTKFCFYHALVARKVFAMRGIIKAFPDEDFCTALNLNFASNPFTMKDDDNANIDCIRVIVQNFSGDYRAALDMPNFYDEHLAVRDYLYSIQ